MNATDLSYLLADSLVEFTEDIIASGRENMHGFDSEVDIQTYDQAGVLSRDAGLIVLIGGKKFYVTISEQ